MARSKRAIHTTLELKTHRIIDDVCRDSGLTKGQVIDAWAENSIKTREELKKEILDSIVNDVMKQYLYDDGIRGAN